LIHDDVMDGAATRRGRPSVHETFARDHHREQWLGEARRFGEGMGVLLGDLALVCAERELVDVATPVRVLWHEMQIELTMGQSLDLVSTAARDRDGRVARSIAILKSGRYTVTRPLQLGAAVAGRLDELAAPYAAIGDPLGEAFQLRDDLLGVFGDPARTGKPVGSDLTEGKATPLAAIAATRCRGREQALLARIGAPDLRPDEVDALCTLLETSGARAAVEHRVRRLGRRALDAIADAPIPPAARAGLRDLARRTLWRES
jgi:geranylgeranyl diphosphate synthase type I